MNTLVHSFFTPKCSLTFCFIHFKVRLYPYFSFIFFVCYKWEDISLIIRHHHHHHYFSYFSTCRSVLFVTLLPPYLFNLLVVTLVIVFSLTTWLWALHIVNRSNWLAFSLPYAAQHRHRFYCFLLTWFRSPVANCSSQTSFGAVYFTTSRKVPLKQEILLYEVNCIRIQKTTDEIPVIFLVRQHDNVFFLYVFLM